MQPPVVSSSHLTYDYSVDHTVDTAGTHVVRLAGNTKRVLEVGAGPGAVTRELLRNGCDVVAMELDEAAIARLRTICRRVYRADLNGSTWRETLADEGPFDVIVAADVLEHLVDPWRVLAELRQLLTPDGYVVISTPHVGHLAVVACLLAEDFEYREWGLLDRTHIRFFGVKNLQDLFDQAGFGIVEADVVLRPPQRTEFGRFWTRLPTELREQLLAANPFGQVYQIIIKAAPREQRVAVRSLRQLLSDRIDARSKQPTLTNVAVREALRGWARANLSDAMLGRVRRLLARAGVRG